MAVDSIVSVDSVVSVIRAPAESVEHEDIEEEQVENEQT